MEFCEEHGIKRKFSAAMTPQQNGVVERKNKNCIRDGYNHVEGFKVDKCILGTISAHIVIHILNRGMLRSNNDKNPYELWKGRPTNVKNFRVFGRKCYIKREDDRVGKFDSRVDKGILVGYSRKIKAYKCYNMKLNKIVESINLNIDEEDVQKIKEENKNTKDKEREEELKEEEVEEEEEDEEQ
jgi:hypothetical protein